MLVCFLLHFDRSRFAPLEYVEWHTKFVLFFAPALFQNIADRSFRSILKLQAKTIRSK